ncbi:cytochrome c biogenesis CcdA family protein [Desulfosporosinus sp. SB140]|uniref:cytochrome c biogenesis CcdA family protein n=1 Tax=Desulfosporosinus paludis TaxID=3115649 RepID=UPI00388CF8CF
MQGQRLRTIVGTVGLIAVVMVCVLFVYQYSFDINTGIHPTLWMAFIAGLLSFVSPCCLPLYPSYISYISGMTFSGNEKHLWSHRLKDDSPILQWKTLYLIWRI